MTTHTPSTPGSELPPSKVWTRRNIMIVVAVLVVIPVLVGVGNAVVDRMWPRTTDNFWAVVAYTAMIEIAACSFILTVGSAVPSLRRRLEIPDPDGDERERAIAAKATKLAYLAAVAGLLVVFMGATMPPGDRNTSIPEMWLVFILVTVQTVHYGGLVYYSRRM